VARHEDRWPDTGPELGRFTQSIEGLITHMLSADHSAELPELVRRTRVFDGARGQDVRTMLPELASLFDDPAVAAEPA
jgi:hypothetical protein